MARCLRCKAGNEWIEGDVPSEERRMPAEPTMGMWDDFMEEWQKHPADFEAFSSAYRVMYANYQHGPQKESPA